MSRWLLGAVLLALAGIVSAQSKNLDIYWIDVEGGAATLLIAPSGESLLYDAGFGPPNAMNDRDAKRIVAAAQAAGLKRIDYFVLSHYHADHVGGLPALAKMIPIGGISTMATRWKTSIVHAWICTSRSRRPPGQRSSQAIRYRSRA